ARNNFLKRLSWEEANLLARFDLNGLAGERVTTLTSLAIYLLKLSKIVDGYIFALLDIAHDGIENDFYSVACLFLASVEVWSQRSNELGLVHLIPLFTRKVKRLLNLSINLRI
ncbi:MAG: hypothetical protein RJA01_741, partial [Actinomycetota bacterium]